MLVMSIERWVTKARHGGATARPWWCKVGDTSDTHKDVNHQAHVSPAAHQQADVVHDMGGNDVPRALGFATVAVVLNLEREEQR